jgi:hypothetical protein
MSASLVGVELENGGVLIKFVQTAVETGGAVHVQHARAGRVSQTTMAGASCGLWTL